MGNHVVIMAGGIGSRLWPMSTVDIPKQFVDDLGVGRTLIQMTFDRFVQVCPIENIWVVTGRKYVDIVRHQLPQIPVDHILAEPAMRNTAPCIAYACWKIRQRHPEANVVVTPSDALVIIHCFRPSYRYCRHQAEPSGDRIRLYRCRGSSCYGFSFRPD